MGAVFNNALKESIKTTKFKFINLEINKVHRAIAILIENGMNSDDMPIKVLEEQLVKITRLRKEVLLK